MATDVEKLLVQLSADIKGYENAMKRAVGMTNRNMRQIETRFAKMNKSLSTGASEAAAGFMKAFALIGGAQGFRTLSDSATRIDNALKVAGLSGQELDSVYQKLLVSAQKNAAPLETLVELYGRASLVQKELGVSSDELISFTDNIAVALRASGKSSQEASGALLQLSQALGSGTVRAEEFNSIQEGAPTILQAAAAGIKQAGGSVAELRKIMLAGGLSSKALFDGIGAGAPVIEQKVSSAVLTIDQRFENLKTSLTDAARRFNTSSQAANTFGSSIDNVASFINSVNMDGLASDIGAIIKLLNEGATAAQNFGEWVGRISGLENIGSGLVNALGENGKISLLGGALNIESTVKNNDKLNRLAEQRLSIEKEIAETRNNPMDVLGPARIRQLEGQLRALNDKAALIEPTIVGGELDYNRFKPPTKQSVNGNKFTPIDLNDAQYKVADDKDGKGSKARLNEYQREVEQMQKRTDALNAETQAYASLNPLVNDYGYSVEYARSKQELLTAAKEAGVKVTPQLTASIEKLAAGYADAVVQSEKLSEKQNEIRERAEEAMATAKDVTRGVIDGLIEGASAADILVNSLKKIGDALIDDVLNSMFKVNSAGGGGIFGNLFGGLFGGGKGFADGGPVGFITSTHKAEIYA
jgi:tape measure domain-containing protein